MRTKVYFPRLVAGREDEISHSFVFFRLGGEVLIVGVPVHPYLVEWWQRRSGLYNKGLGFMHWGIRIDYVKEHRCHDGASVL